MIDWRDSKIEWPSTDNELLITDATGTQLYIGFVCRCSGEEHIGMRCGARHIVTFNKGDEFYWIDSEKIRPQKHNELIMKLPALEIPESMMDFKENIIYDDEDDEPCSMSMREMIKAINEIPGINEEMLKDPIKDK